MTSPTAAEGVNLSSPQVPLRLDPKSSRFYLCSTGVQRIKQQQKKPQKTKAQTPDSPTHTLFDLGGLGRSYTPHSASL